MTMNRIQTDREMKSVVTVIILALGVAFSMPVSYTHLMPGVFVAGNLYYQKEHCMITVSYTHLCKASG